MNTPSIQHAKTLAIELAGGSLLVSRIGNGPKTVFALHGVAESRMSMEQLACGLDSSYTMLTPDLRERGASSSLPGPFDWKRTPPIVDEFSNISDANPQSKSGTQWEHLSPNAWRRKDLTMYVGSSSQMIGCRPRVDSQWVPIWNKLLTDTVMQDSNHVSITLLDRAIGQIATCIQELST